MNEKSSPLILIICIVVMAAVCGGLFFLRSPGEDKPEVAQHTKPVKEKAKEKPEKPETKPDGKGEKDGSEPIEGGLTTEEILPEAQFGSSDELVQNFEEALLRMESVEDLEILLGKLGAGGLTEAQLQDLYDRIGKNGSNLRKGNIMDEIGELERRKHVRWALNLADGGRVFFDVKIGDDGNWKIEKIHDLLSEDSALEAILKDGNVARLDGLLVAHSFVQFAIRQDFSKAKQLIDTTQMSDVHLAGLCIIFDEGGYDLRKPRGVLKSFDRVKSAGYTVYIQSGDGDGDVAQFSLLLARENAAKSWKVVELNFSSLLKKFIEDNGGDSYYTPFVKNPQGGDSIVVYFDFNDNGLSPRTQRQLKIVANILKLDNTKKIVLTGHTDAVGGDDYNKKLSTQRAESVRDFLVNEGVVESQIKTIGYGKHRPREANTRVDGTDNPDGRRANRRTEIYLDF